MFDLAGTGAWETLATSAEVGAITLADVLAVGNATGGNNIVMGTFDAIVGQSTNPVSIRNGVDGFSALQSSDGFARVAATGFFESVLALKYALSSLSASILRLISSSCCHSNFSKVSTSLPYLAFITVYQRPSGAL